MKIITKCGVAIIAAAVASHNTFFASSAFAQMDNPGLHQRGLIHFQPASTSAQINSFLAVHAIDRYTFQASAGQNATLTIKSPHQDVLLTIVDPEGSPIIRYESGASQWSGTLPISGTYIVDAVNVKANTNYTLALSIQ